MMNKRGKWIIPFYVLLLFAIASCSRKNSQKPASNSSSTSSLTSLFSSPGIPGAENAIPDDVGTVLWAGQYSGASTGNQLPDGVNRLTHVGFQTYKIPLDPGDAKNYFGISLPNATANDYLTQLVNTPQVKSALGTPGVRNVVLAVFDAITTGLDGSQRQFTNASFLAAHQTDIINAYRDLALSLFRNYKNTGKRFYIDAWELENSLYCGAAYCYAANQSPNCDGPVANSQNYANFKAFCDQNYQSIYGVATPDQAYANVLIWFQDRQQGVREAQQIAQSEGDTGVTVVDAVEFNTIHLIHDLRDASHPNGYPAALYNVIPALHPAAITYSAYESINKGSLLDDFPTIQSQAGGAEIDISEYGFPAGGNFSVNGSNYTSDQMMTMTTQQILQLHNQGSLGFGIIWQAFNDSGNYGLLNNDGSYLPLFDAMMTAVQTPLGSNSPTSANQPAPAINQGGVVYDNIGSDGNAYITIYGKNLGTSTDPNVNASMNNVTVSMICPNSGIFIYPNVTYNNGSQINADFAPFRTSDSSCQVSVSVFNNGLTLTSNAQSVTIMAGPTSPNPTPTMPPTMNPTPTPFPTPFPTPQPTPPTLSNPTINTAAAAGVDGNNSYVTIKGQYWSGDSNPADFSVSSNNCTIVPNQTYSYNGTDGAYPSDSTRRQVNLAIDNTNRVAPFSCNFTVTRFSDGSSVSTTINNVGEHLPIVTSQSNDGVVGSVTYVTIKGQYWSADAFNAGAFNISSSGCTIEPNQTYSYNGADGADPSNQSKRQVNLAIDNTSFSSPFNCTFTITRQGDNQSVSTTLFGIPNQ